MAWHVQATSHYLNQWWLDYWRIYGSLDLNELNDRVFFSRKWFRIASVFSLKVTFHDTGCIQLELRLYCGCWWPGAFSMRTSAATILTNSKLCLLEFPVVSGLKLWQLLFKYWALTDPNENCHLTLEVLIFISNVDMCGTVDMHYTVRCHYNAVNFLLNVCKQHTIARSSGWDMGYVLVQRLVHVLCCQCRAVYNIMIYWTEL